MGKTKQTKGKKAEKASSPSVSKRSSGREKKEVDYNAEKVITGHKDKGTSKSESEGKSNPSASVCEDRAPIPTKNKDGQLCFEDCPTFRPNLTPKEVMQSGSFGGTYFRDIYSSVTKQHHKDAWKEFPDDWFEGLHIPTQVASQTYDTSKNKYGVKCGTDLEDWESKGWISDIDPCGWFQWYCRYYLGRRSSDDERQLGRAARCFGPTGRWRSQLINKCAKAGKKFDDASISPVIRQVLQHWGYVLTEKDFKAHAKKKGLL